jgi:hypothetical protein
LDGDFFTLLDTPEIGLSECAGKCQAAELHLTVGVEVMSLDGAFIALNCIEARQHLGVEWTTCEQDFLER